MRRSAALALCLATVVCSPACSQGQSQAPLAPAAPAPPAAAAPTAVAAPPDAAATRDILKFADEVLAEVPALRAAQPFGEWKKSHAGAIEVWGRRLSGIPGRDWCARVRFVTSFDVNRTLRTDAYFYLPDPPAVISLPAPGDLLDQCRFGFLWAEVEDVDAVRAERFAALTRESLTSALGSGQLNGSVPWWFGPTSRNTALWNQTAVSVATATTHSLPSQSPRTTRVLVAATGDASGIGLERYALPAETREGMVEAFRETESRINEAISIAALGGNAEARLRSALKLLSDSGAPLRYPRGADNRTFILNAINEWLVPAASLPPTRRAAAIFAADQVIGESGMGFSKDENPPIRQQVEALGAEFVWAGIGKTWLYAHRWLRESLDIDPDGRIGELAFITLMERGFETSGTCRDQPGNGFRAVIDEGRDFLSRKPDSPLAPYVHLLMGQAWGDIVSLANGAGYDESDVEGYKPEEAAARTRAIEEYRLAFASPIQRPFKAREAWRNAWRLTAGQSPTRTYFYCIYD